MYKTAIEPVEWREEHIRLCRTLEAQGFPRECADYLTAERIYAPTLSGLITALGDRFGVLERFHDGSFGAYIPNDCGVNGLGPTPEIALMRLWLAVQGMDAAAEK